MNYRDVLLCSEDLIKTYTNINDNVAGDYLLPAINVAQRADLEEILGSSLVRKIQQLVAEDTIVYDENKQYRELLDDYITDFLCYAAIKELIPIVSFKINNVGAHITEEEKAMYFALRMQKYLIANYNKFPELSDYKSVADLRANLSSAAGCNIWLGGPRNK